jgi:glyoxylase-like metal-dependent hydrolase (beta-lactamase superfamily II)
MRKAVASLRRLTPPFRSGPADLVTLLLALGISLCPRYAVASPGLYQVKEIQPHVFLWVPEDVIDQDGDPGFLRSGNAAFIITTQGVVVIDSTNTPFHARDMLYEIRQRTSLPVVDVINTAPDPDFMLGNEAFTDFAPTIISSDKSGERIRQYQQEMRTKLDTDDSWRLEERLRGIHITPPGQTFQDSMTLNVGDQSFHLFTSIDSSPPLDGDSLVMLQTPKMKILFTGPVYVNGWFPHIGHRNVAAWIKALRQLEGLDADLFVPGHGDPSGKQQIASFRSYLEWLSAQVENHIKKGEPLKDILKVLHPAEIFKFHAPELGSENVMDMYEQLAPHVPLQAPENGKPSPAAPAPASSNF